MHMENNTIWEEKSYTEQGKNCSECSELDQNGSTITTEKKNVKESLNATITNGIFLWINKLNLHYYLKYLKFINYYKINPPPIGTYTEKHHIIPKSMGGSNKKENLVKLIPRAHYLAHYMLWKAYGNREMAWAIIMMNGRCKKTYLKSKLYEKNRIKMSNVMGNSRKGKKLSIEVRKKMSAAHVGKVGSVETRKKMSNSKKGKNNPNYGKERPIETRKKMSNSKKGKNHPNYGKKTSIETCKKISNSLLGKKLSIEVRKKMSAAHKGKMCGEDNPNYGKMVSIETRKKNK